ncbi:MAG: hypothetical protein F6K58_21720 [Symploca sp. SIO2E9]|nr:hypothetical protein [Symploca sp. SIO2E9]
MKCIRCSTDNNLRDRTTNRGRCKNCGHQFAFEPTSMGKIKFTDPFFAKAIADISANNTLFFTPQQFLYFLDKRFKRRYFGARFWCLLAYFVLNGLALNLIGGNWFLIVAPLLNLTFIVNFFRASNSSNLTYKGRKANAKNLQIIGIIILIFGNYIGIVVIDSLSISVTSILLGMLSIYLGTRQLIRQEQIPQSLLITPNQIQDWLRRWRQVNGLQDKILPSPQPQTTPAEISSEISAYSFDRLVVCDRTAIAQMLIANNFHFEYNCAVLSINGYPQSIFSTVLEMLRRNPSLKVYALHDASPSGVSLVHNLRTSPNWFGDGNISIYDLGLLPRQIFKSPKVFVGESEAMRKQARQLSSAVRQNLSAKELSWLEAGKFVELESFTPQKILQVLSQGIARTQAVNGSADGGDGLVAVDGSDINGSYIQFYIYDSFG